MINILDLLCNQSNGNNYAFEKHCDEYTITDNNNGFAAEIDSDGNVAYYVTGCYNSGSDWVEINVAALAEFTRLCECLSAILKETKEVS